MPFKPGKSFDSVNKNLERIARDIDKKVQRGVYIACTIGAAYSDTMTPIDTSNLINSRYINVKERGQGYRGTVGYTANYAAAVHEKPGTLKGKPRANGNGAYWQPNGEPRFLNKGFELHNVEIRNAFIKAIEL